MTDIFDPAEFWREADDFAVEQAHAALGVLCLIHKFDQGDVAMIAAVLAEPDDALRQDLEAQISEETGVDVRLTEEQWAAISLELGGDTPVLETV